MGHVVENQPDATENDIPSDYNLTFAEEPCYGNRSEFIKDIEVFKENLTVLNNKPQDRKC